MKSELTSKKIFIFWFPLALSWLMMSVEGPFVAAVMARLAEAKYNLAAHGVAFSFALIVEAPIISITAATTALCKDAHSYRKLNGFVTILNIVITVCMILMLLPPIFSTIMQDLIGLPDKITALTHTALIILLPWPSSIGFRRFYQGVLITRGLTQRITYGTLIRLAAMAVTALILFSLEVVGAYTGAAALSMGVVSELIAVRLMAQKSIQTVKQIQSDSNSEKELSYGYIAKFYYPLALMSLLSLGVHPMVTFFMGKSRYPIESLAVLPVVNSTVFMFRAIGLSYQETVIALLKNSRKNLQKLQQFAIGMGIVLVAVLSLIAYTPFSTIWFHSISGLDLHLTGFAGLPVRILAFMPALSVFITFQWAVLVHGGKTTHISLATAIEVSAILISLFILTSFANMTGVTAAAVSFFLGRMISNLYLVPHTRRQISLLS
ncbi:hypothetical protein KJ966_21180 [bacterium]|nr:hypothetical protein [bacterium]